MNTHLKKLFSLRRKVFCSCSCGEVFRLSDTEIVERNARIPRDWLSKLEFDIQQLERKKEKLEDRFEIRREEILIAERRKAQSLCQRAVRNVVPNFYKLRINAQDIKSLLHPIRFVAFDGLTRRAVTRITFLDTPGENREHERVQGEIRKAIQKGNVTWSTYRIDDRGGVTREGT